MKAFFRRFRTRVILHILLICATITAAAIVAFQLRRPWFIPPLLGLLSLQVSRLLRLMDQTNRNFVRFLEAINYSDFSQSFTDRNLGRSFSELSRAFTQVVEKFQQARADKEKSYRYLHSIVQYMPNGLVSFDGAGNIDFINRTAKKMLRLRHLHSIHALETKNPSLYRLMQQIRHGEKVLHELHLGTETRQTAISGFEFKVGEKNIKLISIQDVQNLLEDKELEAWQKLIRVLTHEIMNSLTPISSLSSTARDLMAMTSPTKPGLDEKLEEISGALDTIHQRSRGLTDFVKAYRSLTLIPKPRYDILSVRDLFERVHGIMAQKLQGGGIACQRRIDPATLEISADASLMEQVLINLVLNSIHALEAIEAPWVRLKCYLEDNGRVVLEISDNGAGIDPGNRGKIFVPFYSTKRSSGIGLSFCRQVMKLHNGQIKLTSPADPTTFALYF